MTQAVQSIKVQNDSFRKAPEAHGGQWLMTRGITVLPDSDRAAIREKVKACLNTRSETWHRASNIQAHGPFDKCA